MREKVWGFIGTFVIRAVIGIGMIFFINQYLGARNIDVTVGINGISAVTSGVLGLPGIGLLYGIEFYRIL